MSGMLKGRPERQKAGNPESQQSDKSALPPDATVKITTRLSNALHIQMKVIAARNNISIEDAYRDAVEEYLRTR